MKQLIAFIFLIVIINTLGGGLDDTSTYDVTSNTNTATTSQYDSRGPIEITSIEWDGDSCYVTIYNNSEFQIDEVEIKADDGIHVDKNTAYDVESHRYDEIYITGVSRNADIKIVDVDYTIWT